jgi:hypothetical protein
LELRQQFLKQSIIQAESTGDFSPPPEVYPWNISFSLIRHNQIAMTAFKPHYKWEARERKWSVSLKTYFLSYKQICDIHQENNSFLVLSIPAKMNFVVYWQYVNYISDYFALAFCFRSYARKRYFIDKLS